MTLMAAKALTVNDDIDPKTGFCTTTRTFHSLRSRPLPLPSSDQPLSAASFALGRHLHPENPSSTAIIDSATGHHLSYPDFLDQVRSLAASLRWLPKGSVAFVLAPNAPQVPALVIALLSIGVVVSPANPFGTPADVSLMLRLSRPAVVFAAAAAAAKLPSHLSIPVLLLHDIKEQLSDAPVGNASVAVMQSDPAAIMYTSGTSGHVKGAVLTHRNLIAYLAASCSGSIQHPAHVDLLGSFFFHISGFFQLLKTVAMGHTLVVMEQFHLGQALRSVEEYKVTRLFPGPLAVIAMAKGAGAGSDLSSLQEVFFAGCSISGKFLTMFQHRFPGVKLMHRYGLTEAGAVSLENEVKGAYLGSVGVLNPNLEAKVVDAVTGTALFPGQSGELWLRGVSIMQGYAGDEAATSAVLDSEGWLRTGDVCFFDENGGIHVVDRLKEIMRCNGYQVPPAELEELLLSHPDIVDAAVVPYPDDEALELPMAFVVRASASTLDHGMVMDFSAKHVAPYKRIRKVAFVEAIPKNSMGKILRKELIKIAVSEKNK